MTSQQLPVSAIALGCNKILTCCVLDLERLRCGRGGGDRLCGDML